MIMYEMMAEYAALLVSLALLVSVSYDYERRTASGRVLTALYIVAVVTIIVTLGACYWSAPGDSAAYIAMSYVANTLYFVTLPASTLGFLFYVATIVHRIEARDLVRRLRPYTIPYIVYLVVLLTNIANQQVYYITAAQGYVRGVWFQLPYVIGLVNILWILSLLLRNTKLLRGDAGRIIAVTAALDLVAMAIQFYHPDTVMTGLFITLNILMLHLYVQNSSKSTDHLTGLANRVAMRHRLKQRISRGSTFSLYIFSIRGFKQVNQHYGLEVGDKVLISMANLLTNAFPKEVVFRYSGDEFAVLLKRDEAQNEARIQQFLPTVGRPLNIDGNEITMDMVYARVDSKDFGTDVKSLISAADYSISILKAQGGKVRYLHDTTVVDKMITRNAMIQTIKWALEEERFVVHYQPIYSTEKRAFTQAEALVRMMGSEGKLIYPNDFIPVAESTGLIVPMTYQVLERVCADLRALMDDQGEGCPIDSISVNFPYLQFTSPDMEGRIDEIMERYQIPPSMIKIEITERTLVSDAQTTREMMLRMKRRGFFFELDDFGVEYSNLHTILNLPLSIIKLDRSLLLAACSTPENTSFFQHLVAGIRSTQRVAIAEGVEESDQLNLVMGCGCAYIQGYIFSKPLPFEGFTAFVEKDTQGAFLEKISIPY